MIGYWNESKGVIEMKEKNSPFWDDYCRLDKSRKKWLIVPDMLFRHNIRFMFWYRLYQKGNLIGRIGCYRCSRKFGLEFSPDTKIAPGLYLSHPYNITVGEGVEIGRNVNLSKGCTIGNVREGARKGSPTRDESERRGIYGQAYGEARGDPF